MSPELDKMPSLILDLERRFSLDLLRLGFLCDELLPERFEFDFGVTVLLVCCFETAADFFL